MTSVEATNSVLEAMTAGIMGRKADKAAGLTPTRVEASPATLPERIEAKFPFDHPVEVINQSTRQVRRAIEEVMREAAFILEACDAIDGVSGVEPIAPKKREEAAVKAAEQQADRKFADDFAEKQRVAQEQVFQRIAGPPVTEEPSSGWRCPEHGAAFVEQLTSKKGRLYGACTKCKEFEK